MARVLRIDVPNGLYHVPSRGVARRAVVGKEGDRQHRATLLDRMAAGRRWRDSRPGDVNSQHPLYKPGRCAF